MKNLKIQSVIRSVVLAAACIAAFPCRVACPAANHGGTACHDTALGPGSRAEFGNFWLLERPSHRLRPSTTPLSPRRFGGPVPFIHIGEGMFLVDDSEVNYDELNQLRAMNALRRSGRRPVTIPGGTFSPMDSTPGYTTNDLWLEITGKANGTANLVIHPPAAEVTNCVYDLYLTTNLSPNVPGLNLTNWAFVFRTDPGQTNLAVPNLTADTCFFRWAEPMIPMVTAYQMRLRYL